MFPIKSNVVGSRRRHLRSRRPGASSQGGKQGGESNNQKCLVCETAAAHEAAVSGFSLNEEHTQHPGFVSTCNCTAVFLLLSECLQDTKPQFMQLMP